MRSSLTVDQAWGPGVVPQATQSHRLGRSDTRLVPERTRLGDFFGSRRTTSRELGMALTAAAEKLANALLGSKLRSVTPKLGLALSGGGFRAALFHVGVRGRESAMGRGSSSGDRNFPGRRWWGYWWRRREQNLSSPNATDSKGSKELAH